MSEPASVTAPDKEPPLAPVQPDEEKQAQGRWTRWLIWFLRAMAVVSMLKGLYHWSVVLGIGEGPDSRFSTETIPWQTAEMYGPGVVRKLIEHGWPKDVLMNVNFPDLPPDQVTQVEVTTQGRRDQHIVYADKRTDPRGGVYFWFGFKGSPSNPSAGTDLRAVYDGRISVTPLHIDLTHMPTVHDLKAVLGGAPPKGA